MKYNFQTQFLEQKVIWLL